MGTGKLNSTACHLRSIPQFDVATATRLSSPGHVIATGVTYLISVRDNRAVAGTNNGPTPRGPRHVVFGLRFFALHEIVVEDSIVFDVYSSRLSRPQTREYGRGTKTRKKNRKKVPVLGALVRRRPADVFVTQFSVAMATRTTAKWWEGWWVAVATGPAPRPTAAGWLRQSVLIINRYLLDIR